MRVYFEEHGDRVEPPDAECLFRRFNKYEFAIPPTADFVLKYLEKYKEKVFVVKNNADRKRLFEHLMQQKSTEDAR